MAESSSDAAPVSYEDLAMIEAEFEEVDTEIMRKQYTLSQQIYTRRAALLTHIPNFWALVLEQAPPEIDQWILPGDSRILASSLLDLEIRRPELDGPNQDTGNPRSISVKMTFAPNDDFEDEVLEKYFYYRRARDGWTGLVSEPVKVHWKAGKDPTQGLTDGAVGLWEARKRVGDMTAKGVPEYAALKKRVESWNGMNTSFFTWFGWVSPRRWVGEEENEKAVREFVLMKERRKKGEAGDVDDEEEEVKVEEEEAELDDEAVEVHQAGDELAISFADELWPNAIKFFTAAQEADEISEADFEDDDLEEDDEDGDDEPVDIRALVQDKGGKARSRDSSGGAAQPPSKKQKK